MLFAVCWVFLSSVVVWGGGDVWKHRYTTVNRFRHVRLFLIDGRVPVFSSECRLFDYCYLYSRFAARSAFPYIHSTSSGQEKVGGGIPDPIYIPRTPYSIQELGQLIAYIHTRQAHVRQGSCDNTYTHRRCLCPHYSPGRRDPTNVQMAPQRRSPPHGSAGSTPTYAL